MTDQKLTAYTGYNIGLIFLLRIWPTIAQKYSCESEEAHQLFFETVCFEAESYEEWGKAIYRALKDSVAESTLDDFLRKFAYTRKIDSDDKSDFLLSEKEIFQVTIEFCKVYSEQYHKHYKLNLQHAIDYLLNMKNESHSDVAWNTWKFTVSDVLENRKWICNGAFWNFALCLGRFSKDIPENRQMISQLFETKDNIVGTVDHAPYKRTVYLKTLPDGRQLWGYATDVILDVGIEPFYKSTFLSWSAEPEHENGGYFAITIRDPQ